MSSSGWGQFELISLSWFFLCGIILWVLFQVSSIILTPSTLSIGRKKYLFWLSSFSKWGSFSIAPCFSNFNISYTFKDVEISSLAWVAPVIKISGLSSEPLSSIYKSSSVAASSPWARVDDLGFISFASLLFGASTLSGV
jgi:hypothetical protein